MIWFVSEATFIALIGFFGGILLGLAARIGRFCTLGAIEDFIYSSSENRLRMWGLAIGLAIIGTFSFSSFGLINIPEIHYVNSAWNPMASIVGGLMFGYGMALCGNCGYGALARLGGGDLRAFLIVIIMGISTYIVMSGPLAPLRIMIFEVGLKDPDRALGFADTIALYFRISETVAGILTGMIIVVIALAQRNFLKDFISLFWSMVVAMAIISGWIGTTWVSSNGFEPWRIGSHTFAAPVGETIQYAMNGSAIGLSFGIGSVIGVIFGAFFGSVIKGHFRWEACEDPRELRRQILGAAIMGAGAVIAVGCSVGQGLTAFSILSFSAPITLIAIYFGTRFGLKQLIEGLHRN